MGASTILYARMGLLVMGRLFDASGSGWHLHSSRPYTKSIMDVNRQDSSSLLYCSERNGVGCTYAFSRNCKSEFPVNSHFCKGGGIFSLPAPSINNCTVNTRGRRKLKKKEGLKPLFIKRKEYLINDTDFIESLDNMLIRDCLGNNALLT